MESSMQRKIRRFASNNTLRISVSVFFVLNTILLTFSTYFFAYLQRNDFYSGSYLEQYEQVKAELVLRDCELVANAFLEKAGFRNDGDFQAFENRIYNEKSNFSYECSLFSALGDAYRQYEKRPSYGKNIYYNWQDVPKAVTDKIYTTINSQSPIDYDAVTFRYSVSPLSDLSKIQDDYYKAYSTLHAFDQVKYLVVFLSGLSLLLELASLFIVSVTAGLRPGRKGLYQRDVDRIPLYLFCIIGLPPFAIVCYRGYKAIDTLFQWNNLLIHGESARGSLFSGIALQAILAYMLYIFISTASVRLKQPQWVKKSNLYHFLHSGRQSRIRTVLIVLTVAEILLLSLIVYADYPEGLFRELLKSSSSVQMNVYLKFAMIVLDLLFVLTLTLIAFVYSKEISAWMQGTRRIARRRCTSIPENDMSSSSAEHIRNINFLSHTASAETEKRFINESFSTKLIHNVSHNLRVPLSEVADNIASLESGTLSAKEEQGCIERINDLSQNLKKMIEDLIRISKATTGNLETNLVPTDLSMMLAMTMGEFYGMFSEKNLELVTEYPKTPVMILADGQFMWYILDGILSFLMQKSIPGTRIFLKAKQSGSNAVVLFQSCIRGEGMKEDVFTVDSGLGLATAKVFTEQQNGSLRYKCHNDVLTVALRFPIAPDKQPQTNLESKS